MPAQFHMNSASAVLWRTQPDDSAWPSWLSLCSGTPFLRGISWKPMLSPLGPLVNRTIHRMHVLELLMLHVYADRENTENVPVGGWLRRPDTRYVRATRPSASTTHTRMRLF